MATREPQELTDEALQRITRLVHSMIEDRVERGVELSRALHCDSCGLEKAAAGSALYGAYKLCNDCLLEFTIALAEGSVETVAEFMTRTTEPGNLPPSDLLEHRDRFSSRTPLTGRDKLMPSNEPV